MASPRNGLWKILCGWLATILLTLGGAWFTFGQGTITMAQAQEVVAQHKAVEDKTHEATNKEVENCKNHIRAVVDGLKEHTEAFNKMQREQAATNARTEAVVERLEKALDKKQL